MAQDDNKSITAYEAELQAKGDLIKESERAGVTASDKLDAELRAKGMLIDPVSPKGGTFYKGARDAATYDEQLAKKGMLLPNATTYDDELRASGMLIEEMSPAQGTFLKGFKDTKAYDAQLAERGMLIPDAAAGGVKVAEPSVTCKETGPKGPSVK